MTSTRSSLVFLAAAAATLGLVSACGDTDDSIAAPLTIDRPVDVAFGCYGGMRVVGSNGTADVDDQVTSSAMPSTACDTRSKLPAAVPPGQENLTDGDPLAAVEWYGFILQSVPGTVAMVHFATQTSEQVQGTIGVTLSDADPLIPGVNAVAVGELPAAIATDRAGCQVVTANAGTCDLSIIDINSLADNDPSTPPIIREQPVLDATGTAVLARPAAMVAEPAEDAQPIGVTCDPDPQGLMYVAYPSCHLVAAVRVGTGTIEAGIRFNNDGTVDITDGNVSCPAECGDDAVAESPGERPVALDLVHDLRVGTRRLVVGSDNSPNLTVVELGSDYKPTSVQRVALSGDIGVTSIALSPQIGIGGDSDVLEDDGTAGGQHQFVYAVATDGTVRVADVTGTYTECDTQVDPRYLRGITDAQLLACMPVGGPDTPPRRAGATGPGLVTTIGSTPLSVAIAAVNPIDATRPDTAPPLMPVVDGSNLVGYFAFVSTTYGDTQVIDIDDDAYSDFWDSNDTLGTNVIWAVPHQIRDNVTGAALSASDADGKVECTLDSPDTSEALPTNTAASLGGPRLDITGITTTINLAVSASEKQFVLPSVQRYDCHDEVVNSDTAVSTLSYSTPPALRDSTFPDWFEARSEIWSVTWEGTLSRDNVLENIDGPISRDGLIGRDGNAITITDPTQPFCEMGAQPYDFAVLVGCDPTQGDSQCGLGETCYVHPDATVATGSCLPIDQADLLASTCRDFLVSMRHYGILVSDAGEVRAVPRRHILDTTPVSGCTSDDQCTQLAAYQDYLASPDHPEDFTPTTPDHSYKCEDDPTRGGGINRCVETCQSSTDCDAGTVCSSGTCIEGVVPASECVPGAQRYQIHAGEAMTVTGSSSGYLHDIIEDPGTGACVPDPTANPLLVGRIPLTAPPCPDPDDYTTLTPNPCTTTVTEAELAPDYVPNTCNTSDSTGTLVTRQATAIRFKNPAITFNLVDPTYPGDSKCRNDRGGGLVDIPAVRPGYIMQIPIASGFATLRLDAPAVLPIKVRHGPSSSIWVMDEGDNIATDPTQVETRGQVFKVEATNLGTVNTIQ